MNSHSKAKLTPLSRAEMIKRILCLSQPVAKVARDFGLSERCVYKWLAPLSRRGSRKGSLLAPSMFPQNHRGGGGE